MTYLPLPSLPLRLQWLLLPAMNVHMYENAATQHNMDILRGRGISFVEADSGYLACGEEGKGRLADPSVIAKRS